MDTKPDLEAMWAALNDARYEAPEAHIACTPEWLDSMRKQVEPDRMDWPSGAIGGRVFGGVDVFVTGDVTDPRGWEARPGSNPGQFRE